MAAPVRSRAMEELISILNDQLKRNEVMTLKIISCNCIGGKPFSSASVVTQEILSLFQEFPTEKSRMIAFDDIWDVGKLRALVEISQYTNDYNNEEEQRQMKKRKLYKLPSPLSYNDEEIYVLANLKKYVQDIEYHMNRMKKVLGTKGESKHTCDADVVKVLNVHLFNPLSGGKCLINSHISSEEACVCSCGCDIPIEKGPTGIGRESCWHGFADMIICGYLPVKVLQTTDFTKEMKMTDEQHLFNLINSHNNSQVIAETVTNSFAQVNTNPALSGIPIPAFGYTAGQILVFAYDCENDMLLKKMVDMNIFHEDYNTSIIIMMCLYINFTHFMRRDITDTVRKPYLSEFKADFCLNRSVISCYKKASCGIDEFHPPSKWPKLNFYSSANIPY